MSGSHNLWRSDRLVYRGLEKEDEPFLSKLEQTSDSFLNSSPFLPITRCKKTAENFYTFLAERCVLGSLVCLPSPENPDDFSKATPIGIIHLTGGDEKHLSHHRRTEVGIIIASEHQNKGYATEAITWVLRWAFRRAGFHRVGICAFGWNEGAIRLYERLGFLVEARKRDFFWHDGKFHDTVELAMLEDEWRARYDSASATS